ncbi:M20/M25/M40 family metallo-hydrolase [Terrilactibacillus laevilacticus]|uniref:M20/M25/M40 family metallo-hydrolase n=1 Tax=Terrilactibacillus laevilacticus TaxID=1380157 RepID=UPI001146B7FA|nr:M20/M25/M40 family metallo-hydrolase [Terrilactibacillus laevilacticus]
MTDKIRKETKKLIDQALDKLYAYLRFPTISAQHTAIHETVYFVKEMIEELGGEVKILDDCGGNPVIYACFEAGEKADSTKTLLFYNHYDVQPPEPLEEWVTPPFEPTLIGDILYARGTSDNKGSLLTRLLAIRVLQSLDGGLPCQVKFLIEGEEEVGSPSLEGYLQKYQDLFQSDACIWEFGSKDEKERVVMDAGIKGMAYFEITCTGADIDMHSSLGAYVDNAAWRLVQALSSMKNKENEILVEGFFDGITEPTLREKEVVKTLPFDKDTIAKIYGLKRPLITESKEKDPRIAMVFEPTMTICGMYSGYTGEGSKTVLPKQAKAKLDCRLVLGQDPEHVRDCIRVHLDKEGFTDVQIELINGQKAYRSDYDHPFLSLVKKSAEDAYQSDIVLWPNSAGTGPMYLFGENLSLPIVSTGVGWVESKAHAPNESIRIKDFEDCAVHMAYIMKGFSKALDQ